MFRGFAAATCLCEQLARSPTNSVIIPVWRETRAVFDVLLHEVQQCAILVALQEVQPG